MLCSSGCDIRPSDSECVSVLVVLCYEFFGKFGYSDTVFSGAMNHFVVNVCEILDKRNFVDERLFFAGEVVE